MKVVYVWNVSAGKYLLLENALLFHVLQSELLTDTIWAEQPEEAFWYAEELTRVLSL